MKNENKTRRRIGVNVQMDWEELKKIWGRFKDELSNVSKIWGENEEFWKMWLRIEEEKRKWGSCEEDLRIYEDELRKMMGMNSGK